MMMLTYGGDAYTTGFTEYTYDGECGGYNYDIIKYDYYGDGAHTIVVYIADYVVTGYDGSVAYHMCNDDEGAVAGDYEVDGDVA